MKMIGEVATTLLEQRARETAALAKTILKENGPSSFVRRRLRPLSPLIPDAVTLEELAAHAPWELTEAALRAASCERCPATGGACDGESGYYVEGMTPMWDEGARSLRPMPCGRWPIFAKRRALKAAGVPPHMMDVSFLSYSPRNESQALALRKCESYARSATLSDRILLTGPTGVGKTHLASSCLAVLQERASVMFAYLPDFIDQVRREVLSGESVMFQRACTVDFLLLDDLGAERPTDFVREKIEVLLNTRIQKATLFTQNVPIDKLADSLGSPLVRRVMQPTKCVVEIDDDESAARRPLEPAP